MPLNLQISQSLMDHEVRAKGVLDGFCNITNKEKIIPDLALGENLNSWLSSRSEDLCLAAAAAFIFLRTMTAATAA
jgi:hypothetical protein